MYTKKILAGKLTVTQSSSRKSNSSLIDSLWTEISEKSRNAATSLVDMANKSIRYTPEIIEISESPKKLDIKKLIINLTSLLYYVKICAENDHLLSQIQLQLLLDTAVSMCRPLAEGNLGVWKEMEESVNLLKSMFQK